MIPAAAVPVLGLLTYGLTQGSRQPPSMLTGKQAPSFRLETLSGDILSLEELTRDTPLVINFWATWCVPCIREHEVLERLDEQHPDEQLELVGILYQDRPENASRWMRERGGNWPILLDPGSQTAIDYGISGVPETYFITGDGTVLHKHVGPLNGAILSKWVPRLLRSAPRGRRQ